MPHVPIPNKHFRLLIVSYTFIDPQLFNLAAAVTLLLIEPSKAIRTRQPMYEETMYDKVREHLFRLLAANPVAIAVEFQRATRS